jgi:hypothetical protein
MDGPSGVVASGLAELLKQAHVPVLANAWLVTLLEILAARLF